MVDSSSLCMWLREQRWQHQSCSNLLRHLSKALYKSSGPHEDGGLCLTLHLESGERCYTPLPLEFRLPRLSGPLGV